MLYSAEQVMECPMIVTTDMSQGDIDRAWAEHCQRQKAVEQFYDGIREGHWDAGHVEYLLDMLAEQEIDPLEFAEVVIDNVGFVLSGQCSVASDVVG